MLWGKLQSWIQQALISLRNYKDIIGDLLRVNWSAPFDTEGLEGNWASLFFVWFFEQSSPELGEWNGDEVTITSEEYINDFKSKRTYKDTINKLKNTDINNLKVGDQFSGEFEFDGEESTKSDEDAYNMLEWFIGSYNLEIKVTEIDRVNNTVKVEGVVRNESDWESATRIPGSWQEDYNLDKSILKNAPRKDLGPGGTFTQKFVWEEVIQY